jgi:hypothetical protein
MKTEGTMKPAVEDLARLDASGMAWTGALTRPWTRTSGDPIPELWAVIQREAMDAFDCGGSRFAFEIDVISIEHAGKPTGQAVKLTLKVRVTESRWSVLEVGSRWRQRIELRSTPAPFGGVRWWFLCRACGKQRAHLYGSPMPLLAWMCRTCRGATYRSQQEHGASSRKGAGMGAIHLQRWRVESALTVRARRAYRRQVHRLRQRAQLEAE